MIETKSAWKKDENGRWYRELGTGIVEYMTDMILKGKPAEKKDEPPKPRGICPFKTRAGYHTSIGCNGDCVFYNTEEHRCAFGEQMAVMAAPDYSWQAIAASRSILAQRFPCMSITLSSLISSIYVETAFNASIVPT